MTFDIVLIIISVAMLFIGTIGTVVPVLPGVPLCWAGLLVFYFSSYSSISVLTLIITGVVALFVSMADNFLPPYFTKKSGGSKQGTWGSIIGLIVGFFASPLGVILGPFIGAFVGELIFDSSDMNRVFKAACGTFKGFLLGVGMKVLACSIFIIIFILSISIN